MQQILKRQERKPLWDSLCSYCLKEKQQSLGLTKSYECLRLALFSKKNSFFQFERRTKKETLISKMFS